MIIINLLSIANHGYFLGQSVPFFIEPTYIFPKVDPTKLGNFNYILTKTLVKEKGKLGGIEVYAHSSGSITFQVG